MDPITQFIINTLAGHYGFSVEEGTHVVVCAYLDKIEAMGDANTHATIVMSGQIQQPTHSPTAAAQPRKGSQCSVNGQNYEDQILKNCLALRHTTTGTPLCVPQQTGGSSKGCDVTLLSTNGRSFGLESKRYPNPDWGQFGLVDGTALDDAQHKPVRNKAVGVFISDMFVRCVAPQLKKHDPWIRHGGVPNLKGVARTTDEFNELKRTRPDLHDFYIECDRQDLIAAYYSAKGCNYIQVAGLGLYHLGRDTEGFGVPEFKMPTRIRVRTKIHSSGNGAKPFASSWTMAFQPMKAPTPSPYTLDGIGTLPPTLAKITTDTTPITAANGATPP
jgi:hypothetical protein